MPKVARIGDTIEGFCTQHSTYVTGTIITGSDTVFIEGKGVARVGDQALGSCGHTTYIIEGSSKLFADGKAVARIGDAVSGVIEGTIQSGSPTTYSDGM